MVDKKDITGIILAGGKSSRMGCDKGLLRLHEKPFTSHIIEALQPLVSETIIVSDSTSYDVFGLKRVEDLVKDAGPLAGICSGLKFSNKPYNIVLSCDIPLITTELLKILVDHIDADSDIIQVESNNKTMPLIALYKKDCYSSLLDTLQQGERRLQKGLKNFRLKTIPVTSEYALYTMNVNTPQELKIIKDASNC